MIDCAIFPKLTFQWSNASIFLTNAISWTIFVIGTLFLYASNLFVQWISEIAVRTSTEWSVLAWPTNSVSTTNDRSLAYIHTFSLAKRKGIDFTSFSISTIFVASTFFRGGTNSSSAFMKAWTFVVLVTFWYTFVVDANLAG